MASTRLDAGADRRALPAVPLRPAPADRRGRRGRRRRASTRHAPPGAGGARTGPPAAARRRSTQLERGVRRPLDAMPALVGRGDGDRQQLLGRRRRALDDGRSRSSPTTRTWRRPLPGIWYQMGLHCNELGDDCPFDVAGFTFAGFPGVVIGHNQEIAWGFTNLGPDVTDLYLEAVDGERYLRGKQVARRSSVARRRSRSPGRSRSRSPSAPRSTARCSPTSARSTPRSAPTRRCRPTRPDRGGGYAVSLAWTALRADPHRRGGLRDRTGRPDWEEFRAAARAASRHPARTWCTPTATATSATRRPGCIPVRRPAPPGRLPAPRAGTGATTGPASSSPSTRCRRCSTPTEGFIATANQAPVDPAYPYYLGGALGLRLPQPAHRRPARPRRARCRVDDMARDPARHLQRASRRRWCPYLLDVDAGGRYYSAGQRLLRGVGLHPADADSAAAAYFNAVWKNLLRLTFDDQLPPTVAVRRRRPLVRGRAPAAATSRTTRGGTTSTPTTSARVATTSCAQAMRDARDELVRLQSRRADGWTWGHQHTLDAGEPDHRAVRHRAGRGARQPRRLGAGRRHRASSTRSAGTPPRATRSTGCRRCGWSSRWPTSTTRRG